MRLINPGPGELLDRLSILRLKIKAARERKVTAEHFEKEQREILRQLATWADYSPIYREREPEWLGKLAEVNQRVWVAVDEIRVAEARQNTSEVAKWGLAALHGNDDRAAIIFEVNRVCGVPLGAEKITA